MILSMTCKKNITIKFGKNKYIDYRARIKELGYDSSVAIKKIENIYKGKQ